MEEEDRRKHLEMIQAVIARLASNSFITKGWSVTISTALLAFAAESKVYWIALVSLFPIAVFWGLDAYYLALERRYRHLFTTVATGTTGTDFRMEPDAASGPWWPAVRSPSVWLVHAGGFLTVLIVVVLIVVFTDDRSDEKKVLKEAAIFVNGSGRGAAGQAKPIFVVSATGGASALLASGVHDEVQVPPVRVDVLDRALVEPPAPLLIGPDGRARHVGLRYTPYSLLMQEMIERLG